ncbi:hypothetical protein K4A83_04915 [Spirulina subsalsa FACHB-351]|uniref:DUF3592 domain-containing protein n=1 Tax=Spirulina subsalsa FACHB-351 TaxID=234711 RepID=A0ABT3L272_9CYAN|nr:hypothetical protein [Spirulina subsalsa]MCW6035613.1 hypothetical protein [Spirulina subsalsa FACHB-351]
MFSFKPLANLSLWQIILFGLVVGNFIFLGCAWLSTISTILMYAFLIFSFIIAAIFFSFSLNSGWQLVISIIFIVLSGISGVLGGQYYEVARGETVEQISVSEAVNYPKATIFYFNNGAVNNNAVTIYSRRVRNSADRTTRYYYYFVAPIVPSDWRIEDPISLWAACSTTASSINPCRRDWQVLHQAGLRVDSGSNSYYKQAIQKATEDYSLQANSDAPIIEWVADPIAALKQKRFLFLIMISVSNIAFIAASLINYTRIA